ncbi:MAG TPA: LacI family DNA-binding transcriptional regulator [Anaerolineales bacterium]|nr:LacI family DNA-binding transcriptional regulator [Anaerolineales bacterium]
MKPRPTIREVARQANVSPTTVSHVINETRFVSEQLRQRVYQAMDDLGYRPNALARSLRQGETHTLGLILPDSANPFFAEIGRNIEASAFELGYSLILCNTEGDINREHIYVDLLIRKQVDGIIFVGTGDRSDSGDRSDPLGALFQRRLPVVVVDRDLPGIEVDAVLADNLKGGYMATRHLIDLGHRRIACISGPSHLTPSAYRVTGYRNAHHEAGLPVDHSLIQRGDFHPESGRIAASRLFELPDPPTAIFACNDLMAMGALHVAATNGCLVPDELSIIGFDDIELASFSFPPLTTISQPKKKMGEVAVQLLLERIQDKSRPVQRRILSPSLVLRQSTGGQEA